MLAWLHLWMRWFVGIDFEHGSDGHRVFHAFEGGSGIAPPPPK
jgi:hypothetical protein